MITIDDLRKVELCIGRITAAERVPNSEKLLKLTLDIGSETRQIITGIGREYAPETLEDKLIIVVTNLEPKAFLGFESNGMLLAATDESGKATLLTPDKPVAPGSHVS